MRYTVGVASSEAIVVEAFTVGVCAATDQE